MKYRIEIERISDGPRPWEWRVFVIDDTQTFGEPWVTGSKKTAALALEEAVLTLSLSRTEIQTAPNQGIVMDRVLKSFITKD